MRDIVKCFDNVFVASKLEKISYGGYSRLQADINCARDLVASNVKWRYMFNLAATMFPLKTNLEIVQTLKIYNGANDVEYIRTVGEIFLENRFKFKHIEYDGYFKRTSEKYDPPPHGLTIVKGKSYGAYSRPFMDFVVKDQRAKDFLEWCRFTEMPDEHFLVNSSHVIGESSHQCPWWILGLVSKFALSNYQIFH